MFVRCQFHESSISRVALMLVILSYGFFLVRTEKRFGRQSRGTGVDLFVPCYCFIMKVYSKFNCLFYLRSYLQIPMRQAGLGNRGLSRESFHSLLPQRIYCLRMHNLLHGQRYN